MALESQRGIRTRAVHEGLYGGALEGGVVGYVMAHVGGWAIWCRRMLVGGVGEHGVDLEGRGGGAVMVEVLSAERVGNGVDWRVAVDGGLVVVRHERRPRGQAGRRGAAWGEAETRRTKEQRDDKRAAAAYKYSCLCSGVACVLVMLLPSERRGCV